MNDRVKAKALKTLDGMKQIVQNEMMTQGAYLIPEVERPDLAESGAICGGRRACLIGSAWLAYGIKPRGGYTLDSVDEGERAGFLRNRPALKAVYDALNKCAERRFERNPLLGGRDQFDSAAEALFEGNYDDTIDRTDILRLINSARNEIVRA